MVAMRNLVWFVESRYQSRIVSSLRIASGAPNATTKLRMNSPQNVSPARPTHRAPALASCEGLMAG